MIICHRGDSIARLEGFSGGNAEDVLKAVSKLAGAPVPFQPGEPEVLPSVSVSIDYPISLGYRSTGRFIKVVNSRGY